MGSFTLLFVHFCYDVKLCTSAAVEILEENDAQTAETNGTIKIAVGGLSRKKLSGQFLISSNRGAHFEKKKFVGFSLVIHILYNFS